MFADDTNVFFSEKIFEKLFAVANQQLKNIDNWLISNKLSLNIEKTNYIVFHTLHSKIPENTNLQLRDANLKRVQCIKFLGVFVHENLNWKLHMEWLLQKIKVCYGIVRKIQLYLNKNTLFLLYNALIKSHLKYCILTWCNGNKIIAKKFQSTANNFIRLNFGIRQKDSVKSLMKAQNLLSINQLMEREIAYFMYEYCNNHLLAAFEEMLNKNTLRLSSKESRQTRSKSKLFPLFCRIDLTKQSLSYRGPLIWNKVPPTIRKKNYFRSFRKQYHQQVLILK